MHFQEPSFAGGQDECKPTRCHSSGPVIRFPFSLKGSQPEHCGYPGFHLSCNPHGSTEFEFQFPLWASVSVPVRNIVLPILAKATVQKIDYEARAIRVSVLDPSCLPNRVPEVNFSASPFEISGVYDYIEEELGYTLFNCSGKLDGRFLLGPITCLDRVGFQVFAIRSYSSLGDLPSSCAKMYNISFDPGVMINSPEYSVDDIQLNWPKPDCGLCEAEGRYCRLKSNGTNNETECFGKRKDPQPEKKVITVATVGAFLMALAVAALYSVYRVKKKKQENEGRIQRFLEDYSALRPSRYTYSDIKNITDGFKQKLGRGGYGTVFKGTLSTDIPVAVKVLNNVEGNGEEFINEVGTIGKIHHVNVVRLVGYCADGYKRALVYEFLENDSLEKYISLGNQRSTLGWEKLHEIALGIAKGIDYLHQGCNQRILHFDIKPHNILLDHNLNAKVADFGLAKLCSKEKSAVTMTAARGTIGYIAPEVFSRNFGRVTYKSDIYSFGMLLLNMVGGRKIFDAGAQGSSQVYFPEWMYNQLNKGEDIAIQIEKDDEIDVVKRLIIVGLWCIQWYPVDRPSMKVLIQMLEGENLPTMPPNPFAASESANTNSSSSGSGSFLTAVDTSMRSNFE